MTANQKSTELAPNCTFVSPAKGERAARMVPTYGRIVVLKRTGQDSASFDLTDSAYLFGRGAHCDIRIQLATINEEHCRIFRDSDGKAVIENISWQGTIVNGATLTKGEKATLMEGDIITVVERSFRFEVNEPIVANIAAAEVDMMQFTPIKCAASVKVATPLKVNISAPVDEMTPKLEVATLKRTPAKTATPIENLTKTPAKTLTKTPVKTPTKSFTPVKNVTPSKVTGSPVLGSPMRVKTPLTKPVTSPKPTPAERVEMSPRKLGSPVRMAPSSPKKFTPSKNQTPFKAENVIALVQTLSPGSTNKSMVAPVEDSTVAGTFEIVTPSKQMEIIEKTPSTQRSVSKFEVYEAPVTPSAPKTPMAAINAALSTPPPRQSQSSPNINVLFPPTPALAAASRLATESINADALRSSPLTVGTVCTPQAEKIMGTPQMEKVMGTPQAEKIMGTPQMEKVIGTPQMEKVIGTPRVGKVLNTPQMEKVLATPRSPRSPRFSVASAGSPVVVDAEIIASPKLIRVDFFERPDLPNVTEQVFVDDEDQMLVLNQSDDQLDVLEQLESHELQDGQTKLAQTEYNLVLIADGDGRAETVLEEPTVVTSQNVEISDEGVLVDDAAVPNEEDLKKVEMIEASLFNETNDGNVDEALIQEPENVTEVSVVEETMGSAVEETMKSTEKRDTMEEEVESEESKVSSGSSTPRRSTRRTNASTPASAAPIALRSSARKTTAKKTPAPRKQQEIPVNEEPTPRTSRRTPVTRGKKTPATANTDVEESQGRRSVRKAGTTTPATDVTKKSTARKTAVAKVEESEADGASPSYHPRAARGKAKASELTNGSGVDENADPADANKEAPIRSRTPAKRKAEEVLSEDEGRRRSTRARTPAKAN